MAGADQRAPARRQVAGGAHLAGVPTCRGPRRHRSQRRRPLPPGAFDDSVRGRRVVTNPPGSPPRPGGPAGSRGQPQEVARFGGGVADSVVATRVDSGDEHRRDHPGGKCPPAHGQPRPRVRLETDGAAVTVAVEDSSHAPAGLREAAMAMRAPSGLRIVAALCRMWGNAPTPTGKTVWAVIGPENRL